MNSSELHESKDYIHHRADKSIRWEALALLELISECMRKGDDCSIDICRVARKFDMSHYCIKMLINAVGLEFIYVMVGDKVVSGLDLDQVDRAIGRLKPRPPRLVRYSR